MTVKNEHNLSFENDFIFFILGFSRSNYFEKKKSEKFLHIFFYFVTKKSLGFLIKKTPLLHLFPKNDRATFIYASEALHIVFSANIRQWTIYSATNFLEKCRKVVLQAQIFFSGQPLFSNQKKGRFMV